MKLKTSEAEGEVLDRLVAQCEGQVYHGPAWTKYSTDWAQAGPIIEREYISVLSWLVGAWKARTTANDGTEYICEGPTALVAAMRCYVASKLGDEVEVPNEIVS